MRSFQKCVTLCDMRELLTTKEQEVFGYITEYFKQNAQSPTLEEIGRHFGYDSLTSVQRKVVALEQKGYIKRDKFQKRNISILVESENKTHPIPVVGMVACGAPILAIENIESYLPTDTQLIQGNPKDYFYLRASGDSMNKAGIDDGDLVLVRQQSTAKPNERVVALIDDHATIKKLQSGEGYMALVPESTNPEHKPIILREDFAIQGVVVKSFHL